MSDTTRPELPGKLYRVDVYKQGITDSEIHALDARMQRLRVKYPHVEYFIVVSTTDADTAKKKRIPSAGRPKVVVEGKKEPKHVHVGVMGTDGQSAYKFLEDLKERSNRSFQAKQVTYSATSDNDHAWNFIAYSYRQADWYRTSNGFDFFGNLK